MKKAFTLSEALVTLAIIGVLAAILLPVIDNVRPDKDKVTYKKALYNLQNAISNAMDSNVYSAVANSAAYWKDDAIKEQDFCKSIADSLNTSGSINCAGPSSYQNPNFITTDGIRYWGLEGKNFPEADGSTPEVNRTIYVDRGLSENEMTTLASKRGKTSSADAVGMKVQVRYDGKVSTPDTDSFEFENGLIQQSLQSNEGNLAKLGK